MPFNGSGSASAPGANYPAVANTLATAANRNGVDADIYTCLSTAICKDGQTTVTANIPFSNFKITGLGAGTARTDAASLATIQDGTGVYVATVGGTADVITLTPSPPITAYTAGQTFRFLASGPNTTNVTVNVSGLGAKAVTKLGANALVANDIASGALCTITYDGTEFVLGSTAFLSNGQLLAVTAGGIRATYAAGVFTLSGAMRGHLHGLTMSTPGGSTTLTIAAGQATDSTFALPIILGSSIGKTTGAWAVGTGNGGLDTGAIANSTWYHVYAIYRADTGVSDVLFSLSASAPTMPANYSYKRRIGSVKTDGSGNWTAFIQDGDYFRWAASVADINATNPGTSAVSATLSVPTGVNVFALLNAMLTVGAAGSRMYLSDLAANDEAPSTAGTPLATMDATVPNENVAASAMIRTNTSAQIRFRLAASDASTVVKMATLGWIDQRGRTS